MIKNVTITAYTNTQINQSTAIINTIHPAIAMIQYSSRLAE